MEKVEWIELKHFSNEYLDVLHSFVLPAEQEKFTSLPANFTEKIEGQHRIVILHNDVLVGFFILHSTERVKEYTDEPNAMLLTAFSINHIHQGKGYAKQGMLLLRRFVESEFPSCHEIVLAVNHKNIAAQNLYFKVGFKDTSKRKIGPIGEQFIMHLVLADEC